MQQFHNPVFYRTLPPNVITSALPFSSAEFVEETRSMPYPSMKPALSTAATPNRHCPECHSQRVPRRREDKASTEEKREGNVAVCKASESGPVEKGTPQDGCQIALAEDTNIDLRSLILDRKRDLRKLTISKGLCAIELDHLRRLAAAKSIVP